MQTSPTAPKQTLLPHDRGGQLALLPTGEAGGSNGQRRAHASSSGHVTQTKAKMATATTANLTERAAGETESLATVVAAVEMEGAKAGAEAAAAAAGATSRLFSLARLRLKDARKQAPARRAGSTAGGGYVYWQTHQWIALASHHRLHSSCCCPCRCRCPCASRTNSMAWVLSAPNRAVSAPHHGTVVQRDAIHASR